MLQPSAKSIPSESQRTWGLTMSVVRQKRVSIFDKMVVTGIGLGIVYWIIESIYNVFAIDGAGFFDTLFGGGFAGIGTRIIVICLFIVFGSHAQYTINKRRQVEAELTELRAKIQDIKSDLPKSAGNSY
jgi:hypothetical protein